MTTQTTTQTTFRRSIYRRAVLDAFRKLDPRVQVRNPVMFVVGIGSVLTTVLWLPSTALRKDDLFLVETGDIIPSDGEIVEGIASVNESAVTGESTPVVREAGGDRSAVTGGTRMGEPLLRPTGQGAAPSSPCACRCW